MDIEFLGHEGALREALGCKAALVHLAGGGILAEHGKQTFAAVHAEGAGRISGYVLTVADVQRTVAAAARRDRLLRSLTEPPLIPCSSSILRFRASSSLFFSL